MSVIVLALLASFAPAQVHVPTYIAVGRDSFTSVVLLGSWAGFLVAGWRAGRSCARSG